MKILILLSNPNIGGTETFIASICPFFTRKGIDVLVLNTWKDSGAKKLILQNNIKYFEIENYNRIFSINSIIKLFKFVRDNKFDVIMCFGIRISLLSRFLKPFLKIPTIEGLRGLDKWRKWYHVVFDKRTQFLIDYFIPNSQAVEDLRKSREKTPDRKIYTIRNGIDIDYFSKDNICDCGPYNFPKDKVIVATVGSFRIQKGHDFLIRVIKAYEAKLEHAHFVCAGDGPLKESLETRVANNNLTNKITFLGKIDDVRSLLFYSDIVAMPSREEGMPRCIMEAMSMSLPCVATDVGGTKELILQDKTGLMSEFGNIERFGDNLVELVKNEGLRYEFGVNARKYIVRNFDIKNICLEYIDLFKKIIA